MDWWLTLIIIVVITSVLLVIFFLLTALYMFWYFKQMYGRPKNFPKPLPKLNMTEFSGDWFEVASTDQGIFSGKDRKFRFTLNKDATGFDFIRNHTTFGATLSKQKGEILGERYVTIGVNEKGLVAIPASFKSHLTLLSRDPELPFNFTDIKKTLTNLKLPGDKLQPVRQEHILV